MWEHIRSIYVGVLRAMVVCFVSFRCGLVPSPWGTVSVQKGAPLKCMPGHRHDVSWIMTVCSDYTVALAAICSMILTDSQVLLCFGHVTAHAFFRARSGQQLSAACQSACLLFCTMTTAAAILHPAVFTAASSRKLMCQWQPSRAWCLH